ncbi:MAG: prephenate dehydrogenase [Sulfurimonas sp.]
MNLKKVGIVGLGLMGGSLSIALQSLPDKKYRFIGLDHNKTHQEQALELGLVDMVVESIEEISRCDIIILTIPVDGIIAISTEFKNLDEQSTIIDLGSTKAKISASIPTEIRANFVTAHPMTGTEKFGPKAATSKLYENKVVVLCDMEKSGTHQQEVARELFTAIGMKLVYMGAEEHDRHAAFISHMPHALSYALANAVMKQEDANSIVALAGGGFRDMSRIAKSSPHMWEDIFRQNRGNLIEAIENFETELKKCRHMVENNEWEALNTWMGKANKLHDIL